MSDIKNLVEVKHLKEYFPINTGMFKTKPLKAVDDVSFAIRKGETLGLVGESGCGKTTVGRTLLHLYKPTAGEIWFDGKQIVTKQDILEYRKKSAMVFQDPYSSLNPRDSSPPDFPIPGILQARALEWVTISFSNA